MAVFIDPNTGERYENVPDEEVERAQAEFGLVTEQQYADRLKVREEGITGAIARPAVDTGAALGSLWPEALGGLDPEQRALFNEEAARRAGEAQAAGSEFPTATFAGQFGTATALGAAGAGLGAVGAGALGLSAGVGAGLGMLGESALSGVSQEAVDSVTQQRDFSATNALMNGGVDLLLGGGGLLLGKLGSRLLGGGAGDAARAADAGIPQRNILAEIDPGEVPPAVGGKRQPKSAGAAAAANRAYKVEQAAADAAEPFTDDMWESAAKSIDDEGLDSQAKFIAENQEPLTRLAATNVVDHFDDARKIVQDDITIKAKADDARSFAREWTPEQVAEQQKWARETVGDEVESALAHIDDTRKAAADVRAGRAGPRQGGAAAIDAGGIDTAIQKTLKDGLDKVRRAEGVEQAIAVDNFKREIGKLDGMIKRSSSLDQGTKAARTELVTNLYESLRQGLEDTGRFGKFADLQKATNAAHTRLIEPLSRIEARFAERLGDKWGEVGQAAINRRTKTDAVAQFMRAKPEAQLETLADLGEAIGGLEDLARARADFGAGQLDQIPRLLENLRQVKADFNLANVVQIASRRAGEITPGLGERIAEGALGAVTGNVPFVGGALRGEGQRLIQGLRRGAQMPAANTALGQALNDRLKAYARNPYLENAGYSRLLPQWLQGALKGHGGQVAGVAGVLGTAAVLAPGEAAAAELPEQAKARQALAAQLDGLDPESAAMQVHTAEALARINQRVDTRVKGAVTDLFAIARDPKAAPPHRSPEARAIDRRARELDVPRAVARFMGRRDDPVEAWQDKRDLLTSVVADPALLASRMAENLGDLPTQQPEIFAQMVGKTMATVEYLHDKLPGAAGKSALDPGGFPPSFEEITEFSGHWVGAIYPLDSLDDLSTNELLPEQIEAVQALWPEGYARFQTAALEQIHALSQEPGAIPLEALEQIDSALDLDGAGEPVLSSAMAGLIRQAEESEQKRIAEDAAKAPPPPGPTVSKGSERLASSALGSIHGAGV